MDSYLTLDMGNTNASLAFVSFLDGPSVRWLGGWSIDGEAGLGKPQLHPQLDRALKELASLERPQTSSAGISAGIRAGIRAGISAVGPLDRERSMIERLEGAGYAVLARPDAGLVMDIDHPETCGSDRQYAMRAALEDQLELPGAGCGAARVLVIDAGTALTVDAGLAEKPSDGVRLRFLGGSIAMGPGSLAAAISARGARLPDFEVDPDAPALGRSTVQALRSGVAVGFRGAVRELTRQVAQEAFGSLDSVAVYLTGGARDFARSAAIESSPGGLVEEAHLVHAGLARALRAAGTGPRS